MQAQERPEAYPKVFKNHFHALFRARLAANFWDTNETSIMIRRTPPMNI